MIRIKDSLRGRCHEEGINMTPLIDIVFLLLVFFMVTTSFNKNAVIDVQPPVAITAQDRRQDAILLTVSRDGRIFSGEQMLDIRSIRGHIATRDAGYDEKNVVIVADRKADTGVVVEVIDQCRLAGATGIGIAAGRPETIR